MSATSDAPCVAEFGALGDGLKMPTVGLGTFEIPPDDTEAATLLALKLGYRHVDTAEFYRNEEGVGRAIAKSGLDRDQIFITTKLDPGNPNWGQPAKTYDAAVEACRASVARLGVDSVDLYLIHTPLSGAEARLEQWRALVECQRLGLCKSIGVSNFEIAHLRQIEAAGLPLPAANQIELHPLCQKRGLLEYMRERRILPIAYSSLAPLATWRSGYTQFGGSKSLDAKAATPSAIEGLSARLGVSGARLLLRYALQKGWCVLPKSVREERLRENLDLGSFAVPEPMMAELDAMESDQAFAFGRPEEPFDPTKVD